MHSNMDECTEPNKGGDWPCLIYKDRCSRSSTGKRDCTFKNSPENSIA